MALFFFCKVSFEKHPTDHITRLHETHFGSSVNSIPCTVVHSPIEVSSLSPDQLHLTPISTIDGRTAPGHERGRRSTGEDDGVLGRPDGRHVEGGGRHIPAEGGGGHIEGGVRHIQLATTRLFPLGAAAPIDRMPHVQFRSNPLTLTPLPAFLPPSPAARFLRMSKLACSFLLICVERLSSRAHF